MSPINTNYATNATSSASTARAGTDLSDLSSEEFLKLLISELQNQDPLEPMSNQDMVQQIATIQEITATSQLTKTMAAVINGENLSTASTLIGKSIQALSDDGSNIEGEVDRVSIDVNNDSQERTIKLHVGQQTVDLKNVRQIVPTK